MVLAVAETSVWLVALPVAGTLLGLLIGQFGPELFRRRAVAEARYDTAIAAVGRMYAARQGVGLGIPTEYVRAPDEETHAETEHELSKTAVTRYFDAAAEARAALAALYPWSPDLRPHWDQPVVLEEHFEPLIDLLSERRKSPHSRYDEQGNRQSESRWLRL